MRKTSLLSLAATLLLSTACFSRGDQNASHPTLADWKDRLRLQGIVDRAQDGSLRASVVLWPRSEGDVGEQCPHFDIQATINGVAVEVERNAAVGSGFSITCHMPSMETTLDPAFLIDSQRTSFPDPGSTPDIITRFDVELSDRSGHFAFKFGRELPPWIDGRLVRTNTGAMQAGEPVELVFEPPPQTTTSAYLRSQRQYWWLYPANDNPTSASSGVQFLPVAGFEQTASGYAFQWPEVDGGLTEISIGIYPYSEQLPCPFGVCDLQNDVSDFEPSSVSVTIQLPQDPLENDGDAG